MFIMCCFVINSIEITHLNVAYAFRVELPDGNYMLVPDVGEEGPDGDLNHVEVNQDPEEPQTSFADEGKP